MLRWFKADLHVHTCLSPCGDLMMSPRKIIGEVLRQCIDCIAITDHNTTENVQAVMGAAGRSGVIVMPGMEICTREEVHVLGIFETLESAREMQSLVYDHLAGTNNPDVFGLQVIANEHDEVEGFLDKLLIGATDLPLDTIVERIHGLNGLALASHIDRESNSVIGQLGFIPESPHFDALELSVNTGDEEARTRFGEYREYAWVRNSDAHFLNQLGYNTTWYQLERPTIGELKMALLSRDGRTTRTVPLPGERNGQDAD